MSPLALLGLLALPPTGVGAEIDRAARPANLSGRPRRVTIRADFDLPRLESGLWLALEAAVPLYERATGHELPPDETLVFNLYRTIEAYRDATREVGVTGFMDVGAVTAWSTHESYLAVQPRGEEAYLRAAGWVPDLLLQLALHEGVHQFMARAGMYPAQGLPAWYAEGVADHLAERVLLELLAGSGRRWLMLDDARLQVAEAIDERRAIPLDELFALDPVQVDARPDRTLFYDQSRGVVAFLEGDDGGRWGRAWSAWLRHLDAAERPARPSRLPSQRERHRERWLELAGSVGRLERAWWRELPRPETPWREVLGSTQWAGDAVLTAALSWQDDGYVAATGAAPRRPRRFECELDLLDLGGGVAYVVLHAPEDEGDAGLKLTFGSEGRLSVVAWRGSSTQVSALEAPALRRREGFVPIAVDIDGRALVVHVGSDAPVRAVAPGGYPAPGGGSWGLGAWRDAALWRGVRFE